MFQTDEYAQTAPPLYDELRRRTSRPDVKLSALLQRFRVTRPFLSVKSPETESLISVFPQAPPVDLSDVLTQKELQCLRPTSFLSSISLIPQSEPLSNPISLQEHSAKLQSIHPHLEMGTWEDLWRLLCTFRLPDHVLVVAGDPLKNTNGTQCLAIALHRFIIFCPYEQGNFRITSEIMQNNTLWWLARPRA